MRAVIAAMNLRGQRVEIERRDGGGHSEYGHLMLGNAHRERDLVGQRRVFDGDFVNAQRPAQTTRRFAEKLRNGYLTVNDLR